MDINSSIYHLGIQLGLQKAQRRFLSNERCECFVCIDASKKRAIQPSDCVVLFEEDKITTVPFLCFPRSSNKVPATVVGSDAEDFIFGMSRTKPDKICKKNGTAHLLALASLAKSKAAIGPFAKKLHDFLSVESNTAAVFKQFENQVPSKFHGRITIRLKTAASKDYEDIFRIDGYMPWYEQYLESLFVAEDTIRQICILSGKEDYMPDIVAKAPVHGGFAGFFSTGKPSHESFRMKGSGSSIGLFSQQIIVAALNKVLKGSEQSYGKRLFTFDNDAAFVVYAPFGMTNGKVNLIADTEDFVNGITNQKVIQEKKITYHEVLDKTNKVRSHSYKSKNELYYGKTTLETLNREGEDLPIVMTHFKFVKEGGLAVYDFQVRYASTLMTNFLQWVEDLSIILPHDQYYEINGEKKYTPAGTNSLPVGLYTMANAISRKPEIRDQFRSQLFWMLTLGTGPDAKLFRAFISMYTSMLNKPANKASIMPQRRIPISLLQLGHLIIRRHVKEQNKPKPQTITQDTETPTIEQWLGKQQENKKGGETMPRQEDVPKEFSVDFENPLYCAGAAVVVFNHIHFDLLRTNTDFVPIYWNKLRHNYSSHILDFTDRCQKIYHEADKMMRRGQKFWLNEDVKILKQLLAKAMLWKSQGLSDADAGLLCLGIVQRQAYDVKQAKERREKRKKEEQDGKKGQDAA